MGESEPQFIPADREDEHWQAQHDERKRKYQEALRQNPGPKDGETNARRKVSKYGWPEGETSALKADGFLEQLKQDMKKDQEKAKKKRATF